jgi:hypothetical protein
MSGTVVPVPKQSTLRIEVRSADAERARLRTELDRFEQRYGVSSARLAEAFTGPDGALQETEDFHAWDQAWSGYQILTGR